MWFPVSIVSSHGHDIGAGERGRKFFLNSPVYACLVRHWTTRPNTSRLFLRSLKCPVGLREGIRRLAIANLSNLGEFFHSICHSFKMEFLARLFVFEWVALNGIWHPSSVAS
jgi:hypothetical protein